MTRFKVYLTTIVIIGGLIQFASAEQVDVLPLLKKVKAVGPKGTGHRDAIVAMRELSKAEAAQLPQILAGMDNADKLPTNWIRAAAETVAQRSLDRGGKLPVASLEKFLADKSHAPRARRLAYELIRGVDETAEKRLIPAMLNDPSLELRRDAVAMAIDEANAIVPKDEKAGIAAYRKALTAARDLDQIKIATEALRKLGETVDLPTHFGFVMRWNLVGPFDNTHKKGFYVAYGPEKNLNLNEYKGKLGKVSWFEYTTKDEYGNVDLTKALDKHKGAITYAYAEFDSPSQRDIELRLGCINANKVWLNGKLLTANEVYHANTSIDQYIGQGQMKKGKNVILLKICQNEQEESWAQKWQFQLRVCDEFGTAVLSKNRPKTVTAALDKSQN